MTDAGFRAELEDRKRASVAQLLMRCARLVNEEGIRRMNERVDGMRVRQPHMALVPHIALDGTRLTDLARAVGVSKQAVHQLVGELEEMAFLERVPDPSDGRAKLVRFTRRGRRRLLEGLELLAGIDAELEDALGPRKMRELHRALLAAHDHLTAE
jgi:DNA-binding MarR family transcriptional regulator